MIQYDPLIDIAWDDEETPVLDKQEPAEQKQVQQAEDERIGTLYRDDSQQWLCYICAKPTNVYLYMGRYSVKIHSDCATHYLTETKPRQK